MILKVKHEDNYLNPAVVVIAYNRPDSLQRLLNSLLYSNYQKFKKIKLVISIDYSNNLKVFEIAKDFNWVYGEKTIIRHDKNLGLKAHVLACGELSKFYGSIIVLEDDLVVSPFFYSYAVQSLSFFKDDESLAGISLYSPEYNENAKMKFIPANDGFDNFFAQIPSSWGQVWTKSHWQSFMTWYDKNNSAEDLEVNIPKVFAEWKSSSSWKKYFAIYLIRCKKYFVFPRISLTTNMGDAGTHHLKTTSFLQVPLLLGDKKFNFNHLTDSTSVYDSYYELIPECLKKLVPQLEDFDFECDFYGTKKIENITKPYVISSQKSRSMIKSYGLKIFPQEMNVVLNIEGNFFGLFHREELRENSWNKKIEHYILFERDAGIRKYLSIIAWSFLKRFKII